MYFFAPILLSGGLRPPEVSNTESLILSRKSSLFYFKSETGFFNDHSFLNREPQERQKRSPSPARLPHWWQ